MSGESREAKKKRYERDADTNLVFFEQEPEFVQTGWEEKALRIGVYCRVSTGNDNQATSFALQKKYYEEFVTQHKNWTLAGIYADEGLSATSYTKRDNFKRMLADCKSGEIDLIITKNVARFSRNVVDCLGIARDLLRARHPVGIYFQEQNLNTLTNGNEMILTMMSSIAQAESEAKREAMLPHGIPANRETPESATDRQEVFVTQPDLRQTQIPQTAEKGLADLGELQNLEVLRAEFTSSIFKPKVILSYEAISFNKACINLLPDTQFVNVLIDRTKKRIIILPVSQHAKDALRWCVVSRTGEIKKRVCTARKFGEKLYEMMRWVKENKYRVLAYYQEIDGVQLLVFNLRECEMVVPDFITTSAGKVIKRGRVYLPGEWTSGFGMSFAQHGEANVVALNAHYTLSDKDIDVTIADVRVRGKMPTDEEIIMSRYRKEKSQEVFADA